MWWLLPTWLGVAVLRCYVASSTHVEPAQQRNQLLIFSASSSSYLVPNDLNAVTGEESNLKATLPPPPDRLLCTRHVDHRDHVSHLHRSLFNKSLNVYVFVIVHKSTYDTFMNMKPFSCRLFPFPLIHVKKCVLQLCQLIKQKFQLYTLKVLCCFKIGHAFPCFCRRLKGGSVTTGHFQPSCSTRELNTELLRGQSVPVFC